MLQCEMSTCLNVYYSSQDTSMLDIRIQLECSIEFSECIYSSTPQHVSPIFFSSCSVK